MVFARCCLPFVTRLMANESLKRFNAMALVMMAAHVRHLSIPLLVNRLVVTVLKDMDYLRCLHSNILRCNRDLSAPAFTQWSWPSLHHRAVPIKRIRPFKILSYRHNHSSIHPSTVSITLKLRSRLHLTFNHLVANRFLEKKCCS